MRANRLIHEKSPYLQQHAHNPVDWHPWGQEAFDKARAEDKPIFLSIGYSTCHWCHVMERESFENESIANLLNRDFVPIKVDREERPDIDRIYMAFVQASTGSGGWPMSVFLTPQLKPFFGGTYFPPDSRYGRPGFERILEYLAQAWRGDRAKIDQTSAEVIRQLQQQESTGDGARHSLDKGVLDSAFYYFRRTFDTTHGGFGEAPKFPRPAALNFLLRYYYTTRDQEALEMTLATLRAMASGGMYDQLGGGFHRYSVDAMWLVPHFEKMLYDQAQLATSYLEAYQITHDEFFATTARGIFEYVLRDMTHPDGGFFSAEDADSVIDPADPKVKGEGAFYVWSYDEIREVLGEPEADVFSQRYGVRKNGNVENDPHGEFPNKNILFRTRTREAPDASLDLARQKLLAERNKRPRPDRDEKILTSWNSLMISAFAKGAQALEEERYRSAAERAAAFIAKNMLGRPDHTLLRRYRDGEAAIPGFLDDYAFFAQSLLDLYETDFEPARIEMAIAVTSKMRELFEDPVRGGFFTTAEGDASLVLRMKDDYDGAEPSGNSIALMNLLRLAVLTGSEEFRAAADRTLNALAPRIATQPIGVPQMLVALDYSLAAHKQVVLAGAPGSDLMSAFLRALRSRFQPRTVVAAVDDAARAQLERFIPAIAEMKELDGRPTAYVCENYACQLPTHDVEKFDELLQ